MSVTKDIAFNFQVDAQAVTADHRFGFYVGNPVLALDYAFAFDVLGPPLGAKDHTLTFPVDRYGGTRRQRTRRARRP